MKYKVKELHMTNEELAKYLYASGTKELELEDGSMLLTTLLVGDGFVSFFLVPVAQNST